MHKKKLSFTEILRHLAFICVFFALVLKPIISFLSAAKTTTISMVLSDFEENSNSDENQENEEENEEAFKNLILSDTNSSSFLAFSHKNCAYPTQAKLEVFYDIQVPPPEIG